MWDEPLEITDETARLYKEYCGIEDRNELITHLSAIQQKLLDTGLTNYRCIHAFKFASSRLNERFFYKDLIKLGKTLKSPYFLDIGCCTGTDLRQLVLDGYPKTYLMGLDIDKEYIRIGYDQFKETADTCPIKFLTKDIFTIDTHYEYCNTFSIIHAGSVLHLFNTEEEILDLLKHISLLLKPGGVLVGGHVMADKPVRYYREKTKSMKYLMDSQKLCELLTSIGFRDIKLEAVRKEDDPGAEGLTLYWVSFYAVYNR